MKLIYTAALIVSFSSIGYSQVEEETEVVTEEEVIEVKENTTPPDTTRMTFGKTEIIIVEKNGDENEFEEDFEGPEDEDHKKKKSKDKEAHWAGVDFGFSLLMNSNFENKFTNYPYWENDPARSQVWNLNLFEHKFNIAGNYFGITTGAGFSFASVAFNDNYLLRSTPDTLFAEIDTVYSYSKNKLKASYLTVPLLLEFNTNNDPSKSFYLAAGVVGGVRLSSKVKRKGDFEGKSFTQKDKGKYGINAFKLDATARLGYNSWGVFASYSLLPLFETNKTTEVYPLTFGLSLNF